MASDRRRARRAGAKRKSSGPTAGRSQRGGTHRLGLIGRDVAGASRSLSARRVLPVLVAVLFVALGVTALRTELLRVRYALGDATLAEQRLLDEERTLTARRRQLRDPVHLAHAATELGFVRPEHMIDVPPATSRPGATVLAAASGPAARRTPRP